MNRNPVVVDTNVVVAGLITRDVASPVARVLDGMLGAAFPYVVSEALLIEYHAVLARPTLRRHHRLTASEVETLLTEIVRHASVLTPATSSRRAPDPGDQMLWDLLAARDDLRLVTGDKRLIDDPGMRRRVLSPKAFIEAFA